MREIIGGKRMKKFKKILGVLLTVVLSTAMIAGCNKAEKADSTKIVTDSKAVKEEVKGEIKKFTAFIAMPGIELPADNRITTKIAEKIGARADVKLLTGQTAKERIGVMIAGGEYPDFIVGSEGTTALINAGALVALDDYIDKYPNIKKFLKESEWNKLKQPDGHIYIIPQFGIVQGEDTATQHQDEAFWIQKRVLKWAGYPKIETVDEYFDVIQKYLAANPTTEDGQNNIGFESLSDDWRYFCIENPPMFLAGYPNDGCAVVDPTTHKASVYDKLPEAKRYYEKLNELYNKGVVDTEAFTLSYDQYMAKLSSGRVLGMVDQYWDFINAENSLKQQNLDDRTYVSLGLTLDKGVPNKYFSPSALDVGNGIAISTSCKDVEGAMKFMNDLLDPEIMTLRYWGEKDLDYQVDAEGIFSRTEKQREDFRSVDFMNKNQDRYDWFPHYEGLMADGKNTVLPSEQPDEFYATLKPIDKEVLDAYGYKKWTDFLTPVKENSAWFPLWSATNQWTADTAFGIAKQKMGDTKHQWLPKVVMAADGDFEKAWNEYMTVYDKEVDVKAYEDELTAEVARRIAVAEGK